LNGQTLIEATEVAATRDRLSRDPSFVFGLTIPDYWDDAAEVPEHNLPLPEFDDTGFLGRAKDRTAVNKLLVSHHPVITIVGEGGIGKTALALRCLYDLVERGKDQPFDAIIWVSLRTSVLTSAGAREIKDAVKTVLGVFQSAANALGVPNSQKIPLTDLASELLEYMRSFRVLLAVDNLETIDPVDLRPLLLEMPERSKVLFTSRIGLGEIEVRYPLDPLESPTAKHLARKFAQSLNLTSVAAAPDELVGRYVETLHRNPLLIKWFVSGVAGGLDPSQLVFGAQRSFEQAVSFCFENLYERLSEGEQAVLHVVSAANRPLTRAELLLLTDADPTALDTALVRLHNSSMVRRIAKRTPQAYALTDIAGAYLRKVRKTPADVTHRVLRGLAGLRNLAQEETVSRAAYKFDRSTVEWNNSDELIAASFLKKALDDARSDNLQQAIQHVERAKALTPGFSEVYRIEGWIHTRSSDIHLANEAFQQAVELNPHSPRLRYSYGRFLLDDVGDPQGALAELDAALQQEPSDATLLTSRAMCLVRLGEYQQALAIYANLLNKLDQRPKKWRVVTKDQAAEAYRRWMEQDRHLRDNGALRTHFEAAMAILAEARKSGDWDTHTQQRMQRVVDEAARYAAKQNDGTLAKAVIASLLAFDVDPVDTVWRTCDSLREMAERFVSEWRSLAISRADLKHLAEAVAPPLSERSGEIESLWPSFGFVREASGDRWFFHRSNVEPKAAFDRLERGISVRFQMGQNEKGACAVRVRLAE
jgi:LuxR family glucitol operon transcriptional activator